MVDFQDFQVPPKNATRSLLLHTLQKTEKIISFTSRLPRPPIKSHLPSHHFFHHRKVRETNKFEPKIKCSNPGQPATIYQ